MSIAHGREQKKIENIKNIERKNKRNERKIKRNKMEKKRNEKITNLMQKNCGSYQLNTVDDDDDAGRTLWLEIYSHRIAPTYVSILFYVERILKLLYYRGILGIYVVSVYYKKKAILFMNSILYFNVQYRVTYCEWRKSRVEFINCFSRFHYFPIFLKLKKTPNH